VAPLLGNRRCHGNQFVPTSWGEGSSTCQPPTMIGPPTTELLQFLTEYVTWPCDLDLWPLDLGVTSRDAIWVINTCAKFEIIIIIITNEKISDAVAKTLQGHFTRL